MPIWLRKFTFHKLKEYYEKDETIQPQSNIEERPKIFQPDIEPSYISKASPK